MAQMVAEARWLPSRSEAAVCLLLVGAYFVVAALGLRLALPGSSASPVWPPTALALAALYFGGVQLWPAVFFGACFANLSFMLQAGVDVQTALVVSTSIGIGNTLEAVVGVQLLRHVIGEQFPFDSLRGLMAYMLIAAGFAPMLGATIGVSSARLAGLSGAVGLGEHWVTWWLGDASSALILAPLLMVAWRARRQRPNPTWWIELGLLAACLIAVGAWVFGQAAGENGTAPFMFLLLPLLLWAVLRLRTEGAALAVLIVAAIAIHGTLLDHGPFVRPNRNESLLLLQLFMGVIAGATLSLAAALGERDRMSHALAASNAALRKLAFHDPLTGLPNRRVLRDRLIQVSQRIRRHGGEAALLYLDLDKFKRINDSLGHEAGDTLLQEVANRILGTVRAEDSVCRLGGDEFVVLLSEIESATAAGAVASKVIDALRRPLRLGDVDLSVTTSIGIAMLPSDSQDADEIISLADSAMYQAKQDGRNDYRFYRAPPTDTPSAGLQAELELRQAVDEGQIVLRYSPILRLSDDAVVGQQVQMTWQHPQRGCLHASQFLALADDAGLRATLETWMWEQARIELSRLPNARAGDWVASLALSMRQLRDPSLPSVVESWFSETALDTLWVQLEVSGELLQPELLDRLQTLCASGRVGIVLSVGHLSSTDAALPLLRGLPVDSVRIEASVLADLPTEPTAQRIVVAMVALAHGLQLRVLADGVVNEAQRDFLLRSSCDLAVGDHMHPPQTIDELCGKLGVRG